ncbi:enoyl-CoA hydratase-related protein (plasmid) [Sphingobium sp. SJ10-10]|uniref:enoyl-CoA hydratase-related protein n=1 Tax=Sphingobium sp. SJ10-10 TaxID=3114999 RepID=UPI002E16E2B9|nr:enoyl-CoA hydratase-related protein [Sphingobium sp. SJ10-10]
MKQGRYYTLYVEEGVATVTIERRDRMNALHPAAHHELSDLFDALPTMADVRVVIVTGGGEKAFCAGYDLKDNLETGVMEIAPTGFAGFNARVDYPLPVIAAVNGMALGGGFELALACDFIIAADSASFALPEPKVGWAALGGGIQRLPRAVGMKRAMDIILTGRTVKADEALSIGLVSEVAPQQDLMATAGRWASDVAACAPLAIRCSKAVAYQSFDLPSLSAALDISHYPLAQQVMDSEDATEGKRAFVERRPPRWTGR